MATPKSTRPPAFQYYPKDFLTDANVLAMSLTERGAYWTLISVCWLEGTLPSATKALARLLGITDAHMARLWPALAPCFRERQGRLIHPRLERELQKQRDFRDKQAENGRKGGRPSGKGLGNSGLTQPEAKESSSSSVSNLQSSTPVKSGGAASPPPTPRGAPIHQKRNLRAAFEGARGLHVPEGLHQQFVALRNHDGAERELLAFYGRVCEDWSSGSHAADTPDVEMFRFWRARFAEEWPPTAVEKADTGKPDWYRNAMARKRAGAA